MASEQTKNFLEVQLKRGKQDFQVQINSNNLKNSKSTIREFHENYKKKGLYKYIGLNAIKIIFFYLLFSVIVYFTGKYLLDLNSILSFLIENLSDGFVFILFFVSESFLGLVPVDLFVIWSAKFPSPLPYLALLGVLSYLGGIISYHIGTWLSRRPKIKSYTEKRLANYIRVVHKWGGAFIVIAALFPFTPFSMVVIALSLLKYPYKWFLLLAMSRLVRFVIQGILFFDVLNVDSWLL